MTSISPFMAWGSITWLVMVFVLGTIRAKGAVKEENPEKFYEPIVTMTIVFSGFFWFENGFLYAIGFFAASGVAYLFGRAIGRMFGGEQQ